MLQKGKFYKSKYNELYCVVSEDKCPWDDEMWYNAIGVLGNSISERMFFGNEKYELIEVEKDAFLKAYHTALANLTNLTKTIN